MNAILILVLTLAIPCGAAITDNLIKKEEISPELSDQFFACATPCFPTLETCITQAGSSNLSIAVCAIRGAICMLPCLQYLLPPTSPTPPSN